MDKLVNFTPEGFMEYLNEALENETMTVEALDTPNWGVTPAFLLASMQNQLQAERSQYLYPLVFLIGFLTSYLF